MIDVTPESSPEYIYSELFMTFVFNHYSYQEMEASCMVEKGDVVIDCGGYVGDSVIKKLCPIKNGEIILCNVY